jgi:endonuclease-3
MDLFDNRNWSILLEPLILSYKGQRHPLHYKNSYELIVMVILAAQDSDENVNRLTIPFFEMYPNWLSLMSINASDLYPLLDSITNFKNKANWIIALAKELHNKDLPTTISSLTRYRGIGRKSAHVILKELGYNPNGIMVDLHVLRVAPRLGIVRDLKDADIMEQQLLLKLDSSTWSEIGMAISFQGRLICRPIPNCKSCQINTICDYFINEGKV